MLFLYNLSILLYQLAVKTASLFNPKAKQWVKGRENILKSINSTINSKDNIAWFHVSSLGEFEQGRPVMEAFRAKYPDIKILLTFFSPSGYEIRKNYIGADYIFYLPVDSKRNAKKFIRMVKPKVAFFVKYEFWYHYLHQLKQNNVPTYIFSSIFRKQQLFFKWYGGWYRKILNNFTHIYIQNNESKKLLENINISNVTVGGDTRFDRVYELARNAKTNELVAQFTGDQTTIICGSTWEKDEELIAQFIHKNPDNIRWIIAPHEVHNTHIEKIITLFDFPVLKFSEASPENISSSKVLIIDSIGLLSSLYCYGSIAYIGGGFGVGIHNTLEAATYGLPVVFGPNYKRFNEACDLIELKAGFSISNYETFELVVSNLIKDENYRKIASDNAENYVEKMRGGTQIILNDLAI